MLNTSTPENVEKMLSGLIGREVLASKKSVPAKDMKIVGIYRSENDQPVAACIADITFAAHAGAALSLIPAATARNCVKTGKLDNSDLRDNFGEVLNVCSRLFTDKDAHRVTLKKIYFPSDSLPDELGSTVNGSRQRLDLELAIHGYDKGNFALLVF